MNERTRCYECEALNEPSALFCARCGATLRTAVSPSPLPRRHRVTASGAALALAIFVVLLATLFALGAIVYRTTMTEQPVMDPLAGRPGTTATTSTTVPGNSEGSGGGGSTATTQSRGIAVRPQAASASSVLKATSRTDFRAPNLLDEDLETAWNEGAEGPGLGEWVRFDFGESVVLSRIEIANGYQKDEERFQGTIRIRSLKLEYSNGSTQLIDLLDTMDVQAVAMRSQPTDWLKLTIMAVYDDYVWEDAALSEVRLFELAGQ
jgi:hypothetical protein